MSQYQAIKAATNAYIKTNGRQEITGAILNAVMIAAIDSLGKFYQFVGYARPDTDPGNIDQNIAYLAGTPGTYVNLGGYELAEGEVAVLKYNGQWRKEVVYIIPTRVSQLFNDAGYITNAVADLINYYTKEDTFSKAEVNHILSDYYDKAEVDALVDSITGQSFVLSWDGTAAPVVADIPAGVVVTYGGTPYTGTLAASADTLGKIYLVKNGADFDMYVTTANPGYSWILMGSTSIDLSGYATTAVTDALDARITALEDTIDGYDEAVDRYVAQSLTADKYYNTNGTIPNNPSTKTGCYCAKIAVTGGERYRVVGVRSAGAATRLWCTADSNRDRVAYAGLGDEVTRYSVDITIPDSGVAYLVVNLVDYDSQADGFYKVETDLVHHDGLEDDVNDLETRVQALEDAPAVNVIDNLQSTSTTDPLSANQGRVLNEDINGEVVETTEDMPIQEDKYFNTVNSRVPAADSLSNATGTSAVYVFVSPGEVYRIYGKGDSTNHQLYAMADSDRYVVAGGTPGVALNTRTTPLDLTIPEGVARLVVNLYQYNALTDKVQKIGHTTTTCVKTRLNALEQADSDLSALALPLKGKKVMFFGDSVTDYTYNQKGLVNYFAEASLATCYKAAIGGTRFVQRTTPVDNPTTSTQAYAALDICNMVKAWCEADYTKQDAATSYLGDHSARVNALRNNPIGGVDIVCIGGGTNDMTANSPIGNDSDNGFTTIKGSINKMVEMLLTANPKLKIYFYSPVVGYHGAGGRTDANWDDNHQFSSGLTKPEYIDIFTARAKANHIPYINLYWTLGWNQTNFSNYFLDSDDHHPYKGFDVIGRRLYQQVVTNLE